MFAKQLAVSLFLLIAASALADGDAAIDSPPIANPVVNFARPVQLAVPPEPTIAAAVGAAKDPRHDQVASAAAEASAPQQVLVHLQLVEISMTKLRKMGIDASILHNDSNRPADSPVQSDSIGDSHVPTPEGRLSAGFAIVRDDDALAGFLKRLEENNIAKVLADPKILTLSEHPASLHIGGDIPLPSGPGPASAVDFRHYGTEVNLLAKVLQSGDIDLDVKFRVSELNQSGLATIGGVQVPTITSREICTNVVVPNHQTAVLTGLNEERTESQFRDGHVEDQTNEVRTLATITAEIVPQVVRK